MFASSVHMPRSKLPKETAGSAHFLPLEDLIEEAATKLVSGNSEALLSPDDVQRLSSLRCIQAAMRRVCEYKGWSVRMPPIICVTNI